jgi:hypothetical protein
MCSDKFVIDRVEELHLLVQWRLLVELDELGNGVHLNIANNIHATIPLDLAVLNLAFASVANRETIMNDVPRPVERALLLSIQRNTCQSHFCMLIGWHLT